MYDILTLQLPEPEEEQAAGSLHDILDALSSQRSPGQDVEELLDILDNPHMRVSLITVDTGQAYGISSISLPFKNR